MKLNELRQMKIWLRAAGESGKAPFSVYSNRNGSHKFPKEWGTYDEAMSACKKLGGSGVGIALGNGIAGIDFDHVRNPDTGVVVPEVRHIVEQLNTYTEISKSGTGLHVYILVDPKLNIPSRGDKPVLGWENPANDGQKAALAYHHPLLDESTGDMDSKAKFYVLTGDVFEGKDTLHERTEEFKALAARFPPGSEGRQENRTVQRTVQENPKRDYQYIKLVELTAEDWQKVKRDSKLSHYFKGKLSNNDNSANDYAFVSRGLEIFGNNGSKVYSLWKNPSCGLYHDKDSKRGRQNYKGGFIDYEEWTIYRALYGETESHVAMDIAAAIKRGEIIEKNATLTEPKKRSINYQKQSRSNALAYFKNAHYENDIEGLRVYANRFTGFKNLDAVQPLYPGLYVFGASSGLGKTTWMHQLGDQLAERGEHVLFFSLEQTQLEMVTKSLSRIMYKVDPEHAVSAIDIRRGYTNESVPVSQQLVANAIQVYEEYAERVEVVNCTFETTAEDIIQYVKDFMQQNPGIKPVVIIDYLQAIPGAEDDKKQTTVDITSLNIKQIKTFQKETQLTVFLISSLNRANYSTQLSFEAFKNSGDIEYTADVVWGLQLAVMDSGAFDNPESKKGLKRKIIKKAYNEPLRRLQFVCLKNRFGRRVDVDFDYEPKFDYFAVSDEEEREKFYETIASMNDAELWTFLCTGIDEKKVKEGLEEFKAAKNKNDAGEDWRKNDRGKGNAKISSYEDESGDYIA